MTSSPLPSSSRPEHRAHARRSGEIPVFFSLPHIFLLAVLTLCLTTTATALAQAALPKNYQTILDNKDVLVMRVHYGPHEFVPMHDHSAYPTVYVYLNDSGEVRIDHEPPNAFSVTRPPTHTGAFRIAPGMKERHSITNLSDLPSDFLRVELKSIPPTAIKQVFRGEAPTPPYHSSTENVYINSGLRIERVTCAAVEKCGDGVERAPSLVVVIPLNSTHQPKQSPVIWLPSNKNLSDIGSEAFEGLDEPYEILRLLLPTH